MMANYEIVELIAIIAKFDWHRFTIFFYNVDVQNEKFSNFLLKLKQSGQMLVAFTQK